MTIENPIPGFRFLVVLDPGELKIPTGLPDLVPLVVLAQFQEVKGLGAELEVLPYAEGGRNDYVHQLPVRHTWSRITLKRGLIRDLGLFYWYTAGLTQTLGARRNGAIVLMTPKGTPAIIWSFFDAIATKWVGPELNSMTNALAVESIEIAHQGIISFPVSLPGMD